MSTDDDDLLARLGEAQRERDRAYPAGLESYVRGELSRQQVLDAAPPEEHERLAAMMDALGPFDRDEPRAVAMRLATQLRPSTPPESSAADAPIDLAERRRRRRWWLGGLMGIAAAGLVFVLTKGKAESPAAGPDKIAAAQLPSFGLTVRDTPVHSIRHHDDAASPRRRTYQQDSEIHWVLTPLRPVASKVGLVMVATPAAGGERRLIRPAAVRRLEEGGLAVQGRVRDQLGLGPGEWSLSFLVGPPRVLPNDLSGVDRGGRWVVADDGVVVEILP